MFSNPFVRSISILALVLGLGMLFFNQFQSKWNLGWLSWISLLYYYLLSLVIYLVSASGIKKDNKTFITRVYSSIGLRFVFSLGPIFIYLLFSPVKEMSFIISYLLFYLFFTAFEIYFLVVNLRPDSTQKDV